MTIYLSGPITGTNDFKERFAETEKKVRAGFPQAIILNPVDFCAAIPDGSKHSVYMRKCLQVLSTASHIYFMQGWIDSRGCIMESEEAAVRGIQKLNIDFQFQGNLWKGKH